MAFVTAIGDIFPLVTAITDTNVSNGCDNGAVTDNNTANVSLVRFGFHLGTRYEIMVLDLLHICIFVILKQKYMI